MKKKLLLVAVVFTSVTIASAQEAKTPELKSKKGENYLPEAGDLAIGFDALPFIGTMGNLVSNNPNTVVTGTGGATNYITLKKFKDAQTAYRAIVGINFGTTTTKAIVAAIPATVPATFVEDKSKVATHNIILGGGLEKRRGSTRLQGYYGAMAMITLGGGTKTTNTYGNVLSAANPGPRVASTKTGSTFGVGVQGFLGAEYFILPKLSLGAEYWWGVNYSTTGDGQTVTDTFAAGTTTSTTTKTGGNNAFTLGGKYGSNAMVFVNFHF